MILRILSEWVPLQQSRPTYICSSVHDVYNYIFGAFALCHPSRPANELHCEVFVDETKAAQSRLLSLRLRQILSPDDLVRLLLLPSDLQPQAPDGS
jgi:hypothetical protein